MGAGRSHGVILAAASRKGSGTALVDRMRAAAAQVGVAVDEDTLSRLQRFLELLAVWNRRIHLTGERDVDVLASKHVVDSLLPVGRLPPTGLVVDVGSGAGFPGLVLACARPDLDIVLVESRRRPASFLTEAARTVPLPRARVAATRAEQLKDDPAVAGRATVVISRALRLDVFLALAAPLLAGDGVAISMQTPRLDTSTAAGMGAEHGLVPAGLQDYRLQDGASRRLVVFRRR